MTARTAEIARLLLLSLFALGCGRAPFNLNKPISFNVASLATIAPWADEVANATLVGAVRELRGSVGANLAQVVFVWVGDAQACIARGESRGFYFSGSSSIFLCPPSANSRAEFRITLKHELGHVFGAKHLPCETTAIMPPQIECALGRGEDPGYTAADIDDICSSGEVIGGICG